MQHLAKLVHADEWVQSLIESHPDTPARAATIARHNAEVVTIRSSLGDVLPHLLPVVTDLNRYQELMGPSRGRWL